MLGSITCVAPQDQGHPEFLLIDPDVKNVGQFH